jgi:hypothetical protein
MFTQKDFSERVKNFVDKLIQVNQELCNSNKSLHETEIQNNIQYKLENLARMVDEKTFYSSDMEKIHLRSKFVKVILEALGGNSILLDSNLFIDIGSYLDIKTKEVFYTIHATPSSRNRVGHDVFSVDTKKEAEYLVKTWPYSTEDGVTWYYSIKETLTHFGDLNRSRWPY